MCSVKPALYDSLLQDPQFDFETDLRVGGDVGCYYADIDY